VQPGRPDSSSRNLGWHLARRYVASYLDKQISISDAVVDILRSNSFASLTKCKTSCLYTDEQFGQVRPGCSSRGAAGLAGPNGPWAHACWSGGRSALLPSVQVGDQGFGHGGEDCGSQGHQAPWAVPSATSHTSQWHLPLGLWLQEGHETPVTTLERDDSGACPPDTDSLKLTFPSYFDVSGGRLRHPALGCLWRLECAT